MATLLAPSKAEGAVEAPGSSDHEWPPPIQPRWFTYKGAWSPKDAVEIPHRGSLLRFCDADSQTLEQAFLARKDELERCWWEEEANLQAGPKGSAATAHQSATTTTQSQDPASSLDSDTNPSWVDFMVSSTGEEVGVLVRSGTYEVDLCKRQCRPCFWPSSIHRVLRGTWFAQKGEEWIPLREPVSDQLEQAYVSRIWSPSMGLLKLVSELKAASSPEKGSSTNTSIPVTAARINLNTTFDSGLYALFVSENEAYLCRDSSFKWLRKLGASSAAAPTKMRLRRGYVPPISASGLAKEADVAAEVLDNAAAETAPTHLVLVVHGIGQTLQVADIAQDALSLRACLRQVEKDILNSAGAAGSGDKSKPTSPVKPALNNPSRNEEKSEEATNIKKTRVEVIPVQWRRTLSLEVDALAAALRPPGIPALRQVLHSTAVEVLLYLTPLHRAAVLDSLVSSLNSAYSRFMLRNPDFNGKVSIMAHSLGSVLCWDILCNQPMAAQAMQPPLFAPLDHSSQIPASTISSTGWSAAPVEISQLVFEVDQLILAGSPLGCFLALRGVDYSKNRGLGTKSSAPLMQCHPDFAVLPDGLPAVRRVYQVYHPFDPVAYKLEPLAYSSVELAKHKTAFLELYGGGRRVHIAAAELSDTVSSAASRLGSTLAGALTFRSKSSKKLKVDEERSEKMQHDDHDEESVTTMEVDAATTTTSTAPPTSIARVAGGALPSVGGWPNCSDGRLDFSLQEASLENQYVSALSAHFVYWSSMDVALLVYRAVNGVDVISGKPLFVSLSENTTMIRKMEVEEEKDIVFGSPDV